MVKFFIPANRKVILINVRIPILLIAYNRPLTLAKQFLRLDSISAREIRISIDGLKVNSSPQQSQAWKECIDRAQLWANASHHSVSVIIHEENLGLYNHFRIILGEMFKDHQVAVVLEDDVNFRSEYIDFVDHNCDILTSGSYWSIQGNNPAQGRDLVDLPLENNVVFSETHVHTISGWCSSADSINRFLYFSNPEVPWSEVTQAIEDFSRKITRDPFLRTGIRATWMRKAQRARNLDSNGSWDNAWELAAWSSGKCSLMPSYSLTREIEDQSEGQSHSHKSLGEEWDSHNTPKTIQVSKSVDKFLKSSDLKMIRIWGIRRRYCWLHFIRLTRERIILGKINA